MTSFMEFMGAYEEEGHIKLVSLLSRSHKWSKCCRLFISLNPLINRLLSTAKELPLIVAISYLHVL